MPNSKRPIQVTLLTKSQCSYCEDAKHLLNLLKGEYWLSVETIDIHTPAGEAIAKRGDILFPPGVFLDGEPFSYGRVSERKLRRELERRTRIQESTRTSQGRYSRAHVEHMRSQ